MSLAFSALSRLKGRDFDGSAKRAGHHVGKRRNFNLHQEINEILNPLEMDASASIEDEEIYREEDVQSTSLLKTLNSQQQSQKGEALTARGADRRHFMFQVAPPHSTPHLRVWPRELPVISRGVLGDFEISLNLSRTGLFKACLVIEPQNMPGAEPYEIPFQCYGEVVEFAIDRGMNTPLDFGIIPYGERKKLSRIITNKGRVKTDFHVRTVCKGLIAKPHTGSLAPGERVKIQFEYLPEPILLDPTSTGNITEMDITKHNKFATLNKYAAKPPKKKQSKTSTRRAQSLKKKKLDEKPQRKSSITGAIEQPPVIIESVHSASALTLAVYGSGGASKLSISSMTLEFDRCMLRRPTTKHIRIRNEGDAALIVTDLQLQCSDSVYDDVFQRGDDWPGGFPINIAPGNDWLTIPITFTPPMEQQFSALLIISCSSGENREVLVRGTGRAVDVALSTDALQFLNTIVGNSYEKTFSVRNTGDLGYAVKLTVRARPGEQDQLGRLGQSSSSSPVDTSEMEAMEFTNAASRDVSVRPSHIQLGAFGSQQITVIYKSSAVTDTEVLLQAESPHAILQIPIRLHSGTASLKLSPGTINFGHFQANPLELREDILKLTNTGSVAFSYRIKKALTAESQAKRRALLDRRANARKAEEESNRRQGKRSRRGSVYLLQHMKISNETELDDSSALTSSSINEYDTNIEFNEPDPTPRYQLSQWSGRLGPGDTHEIYVRLNQTETVSHFSNTYNEPINYEKKLLTGRFRDELFIETEVSGSVQFVVIQGHPEKAVLHGNTLDAFRAGVDFGACAVGSEVRKKLSVKNIGGFEMKIAVQADLGLSEKGTSQDGLHGLIETWIQPILGSTKDLISDSKQESPVDVQSKSTITNLAKNRKLGEFTIPKNGGECEIVVAWTPTGSFQVDTAFTVTTSIPHLACSKDKSDNTSASSSPSMHVVSVKGSGHYPRISIEPSIVNFGPVAVGCETTVNTFLIRNHGACPVPWNIPSIPKMFWFSETEQSLARSSGMIAPHGGTVEVGVVARPSKKGYFSEDIMICAPNMGNYRIMTMTGEARVMHLRVVPKVINFGIIERIRDAIFTETRAISITHLSGAQKDEDTRKIDHAKTSTQEDGKSESDFVVISRQVIRLINDGDIKLSMRVGQGLSSKFGISKDELLLADSAQRTFMENINVSIPPVHSSINLEQSFGPAHESGGPKILVTPSSTITLLPGEETSVTVELTACGNPEGFGQFETTVDILSVETGWSVPVRGEYVNCVHRHGIEEDKMDTSDAYDDEIGVFADGTINNE